MAIARENIKIKGHKGTWYQIAKSVIQGKEVFLLEHEEYGDMAPALIVDKKDNILCSNVWNGFSDYREKLGI